MAVDAKDIFEAKSVPLQEVLGEANTGYYIPAYQRDYNWEADKVAKLLQDLLQAFNNLIRDEEAFAFLGTVIFIHDTDFKTIDPMVKGEVPSKVLNVIDGQQRLTTLLALIVALHAKIDRTRRAIKDTTPQVVWIENATEEALSSLEDCIRFVRFKTHDPYPRMIRAFEDQWASGSAARYKSPIAALCAEYSTYLDDPTKAAFKPSDVGTSLQKRFSEISRFLDQLSDGHVAEEMGDDPSLARIASSDEFQKSLTKFEFAEEVRGELASGVHSPYVKHLLLVLFANFTLKRIALTTVKGKNEYYAFEVFESLNTTGEPLTAFETFKPRVVRAESLAAYKSSRAKTQVDIAHDYIQSFRASQQQNVTSDLLVQFALVQSGDKVAKKLTEQRKYLQEQFALCAEDEDARYGFLSEMARTATFTQEAWHTQPAAVGGVPLDDISVTLLWVLKDMNHSVALAPLIRYYSCVMNGAGSSVLNEAIHAVAAFSLLWRAANGGTANIDALYRSLMSECLARANGETVVGVDVLRAELRKALATKYVDKASWLADARQVPIYRHKTIAKALLVCAYHGSAPDLTEPGLITVGKSGISPTLLPIYWSTAWTLEHVAPQKPSPGEWPSNIYDDSSFVDRIGNLVLVPGAENSALSRRPWAEKSVLYSALGASTEAEAKAILDSAVTSGVVFGSSTAELAKASSHLPQLSCLGDRGRVAGLDHDKSFIELRGARLLDLAWERLYSWLA